MSMWTLTGTGASITGTGDAATGARALSFWAGTAYTFGLTQQLTGVPAGSYTLVATAQGGGAGSGDQVLLTATTAQGTTSAPFALTGWRLWNSPQVPVEVGADGLVTLGVDAALSGGAWGTVDDVRLIRTAGAAADTSALEDLVAQAAAVDRDLWTAGSLADLDEAVAVAGVVLGALAPAQDQVDAAADLLADALDALTAPGGPTPRRPPRRIRSRPRRPRRRPAGPPGPPGPRRSS